MHITNVHARPIAAPADTVGALIDEMSAGGGRIWPEERWPTAPMSFDQGFDIGSTGRHGSIGYVVEHHEPGRSVVFRFDPGSSLDGIHRLDVEPVDEGSSRLTHTLDATVRRRLAPVVPVLLGYHDAMVEDLLARADHFATGTALRYSSVPRWLRAMNAAEIAWWRLRGRLPRERAAVPARS